MLTIDITLVYQMIGFVVLLYIMNYLLYKPLLKILSDRDEKIDGTLKSASETENKVAGGLAEYEKRIKEATLSGIEAKNKLRQEALDREKELIEIAREKGTHELEAMKKEIEKSKEEALEGLKAETKTISRSIAEKMLNRKVVAALFAFILPLLPLIATASEEAQGGRNLDMLWKVINFAILVIAIVIIWKKVVAKILIKRSEDIKQAMEDAKVAKETADKNAAEYAAKVSMLDKRIEELAKELEAEGEADKQKILAQAEAAAEKIMKQAKLTAEQEVIKAKAEIRLEAVQIAMEMAEEILNKELKPDDQEKLVKGYLDNLRLN